MNPYKPHLLSRYWLVGLCFVFMSEALAFTPFTSRPPRILPPDPAFEAQLSASLDEVFGPEARLRSSVYGSETNPRCATLLLRELSLNLYRLSPEARARYAPLLARPSENKPVGSGDIPYWGSQGSYSESKISSTHFIVHYVDAALWPSHPARTVSSFAQQISDALEYAASIENTALGWSYPPADYPGYPSGYDDGGDARFDVYLGDCGEDSIFGYVAGEFQVTSAPGVAYTSFMVLDNDFSVAQFGPGEPLNFMKATVAHEYSHACQYAYNANDSEKWFYETTATWMEDQVFDSVNDYYRFLPHFFEYPETSIRTYDGSHEYGAGVWNHFLSKRFGSEMILNVWRDTATGGSSHPTLLQTQQSRLAAAGSSMADEFGRFAAWNYLTGSRADSAYYPQSGGWPEIFTAASETHSTLPAVNPSTIPYPPTQLGANYIVFQSSAVTSLGKMTFNFQGNGTTLWRLWMVARQGSTTIVQPVTLNSSAAGQAVVSINSPYTWIAFVPSVVVSSGSLTTSYTYTYNASFEPSASASNHYLLLE